MSRQDAENLSAGLLASYGSVWSELQARQEALRTERYPKRAARRLATWASDQMDELDTQASNWLSQEWSGVYGWGAVDADRNWDWGKDAIKAATSSANDLYVQLYGATSGVVRTTARLARTSQLDSGMAARQFADLLRMHGAAAVIYRNGARVGLDTYAAMAIRTATSLTYNTAMIGAGKDKGALFFECQDGSQCGLSNHGDTTRADGLIETADFAMANLISHPACVRTWQPRYDISSAEQVDAIREASLADAVSSGNVER